MNLPKFLTRKNFIPLTNRVRFASSIWEVSWLQDTVEGYIRNGYAGNADLYAVVSYLLELSGNVGYKIVDDRGEDASQTKGGKALAQLLKNPQKGLTYTEWMKQVLGYRWLTGTAYLYAPWLTSGQNKGTTMEMPYIPTQNITVEKDESGELLFKWSLNGKIKPVTQASNEILQVKLPQFLTDTNEANVGMSPVKPTVKTLTSSNEGTTSQVRRFQNQFGDGILGVKGGADDKESKDLQAVIENNSGSGKSGRITVVGSDISYVKTGISAVDTQLMENQKACLHTFCRVYNLPAELVDPTATKTYNNVREAKSAAYTMAVMPAVNQLFQSLDAWFARQKAYPGVHVVADTSNIPELQRDISAIATAFRGVWQITGNEFREMIGLDPLDDPDMDTVLIPANLMPADFQPQTETNLNGKSDYRTRSVQH